MHVRICIIFYASGYFSVYYLKYFEVQEHNVLLREFVFIIGRHYILSSQIGSMASFKQLFSAAPANSVAQLFTRPRLIVYGIIAFGPGSLAWLFLHSVKLEMEKDNEAARLVMLGKARAEVEAEERKEAMQKAELEGVLHRVETLQERLKAMEHVVFGTTSPDSRDVIKVDSKEVVANRKNSHTESQESLVVTPPSVPTTKAFLARLHAYVWDEEDAISFEKWLTFCKGKWNDLWDSWSGRKKEIVQKNIESNAQVADRRWATVGDLCQKTMPRPPPQPNVTCKRIQEIVKGISGNEQTMGMENAVSFPAPELTIGEYIYISLWKNEKHDIEPMTDEKIDEKVNQRLASYYQSDIARRNEAAHQGTKIRHN